MTRHDHAAQRLDTEATAARDCGEVIAAARLEARPTARTCVACA